MEGSLQRVYPSSVFMLYSYLRADSLMRNITEYDGYLYDKSHENMSEKLYLCGKQTLNYK